MIKSRPARESRHTLALQNIAQGGSFIEAAKIAGFSPYTAKKGKNGLRKLKTWPEMLEKLFPDKLLTKIHLEGLEAMQYIPQGIGRGETQLIEKPDHSVRFKFLSKAYDLKGKSLPSGVGASIGHVSINIIAPPASEQPKPVEYVDNGSTEPK